MKIWEFLNGKKTTIGALLMVAAQALTLLGYGEWANIIKQVSEIIHNLGIGIASVGLGHKAIK